MSERDEVQVARWGAIKSTVGQRLRELRQGRSQARLSGDLEDLGYHVNQSMISRYEQGLVDTPLSRERLIGWALCCDSLSADAFRSLLEQLGYAVPWVAEDLRQFDAMLLQYRDLPLPDQIVLRQRLLWHILGIDEAARGD